MIFRVLEYVVLIFKKQMLEWVHEHGTRDGFRFQPVLPVVLYSGTRTWEGLGKLVDLVAQGEKFAEVIPSLQPLFLNLGQTPAESLESRGGAFGWLLRLIQQRKARLSVFRQTLEQAVCALEELADDGRERWLELLSYLYALVYYEREPFEQSPLHDRIEVSVQTDPHRKEVFHMGKKIADVLKEEGEVRGLKKTLIRQLHKKFSRVPDQIVECVEAATETEQLNTWLDEIITARKLSDVSIPPAD